MLTDYRKNLRDAMKWLRKQQPNVQFKTIHHGYFGHAVMVKRDADGFQYYRQAGEVIKDWQAAGQP